MSDKKGQRTKGNTKPSSSSRAAQFLQQEGQIEFTMFSGLKGTQVNDSSMLDGELKMLLRKMSKKDTITKIKAIQEFTTICKEKDIDSIKSILIIWPRIFNKLSLDYDHRVREATLHAHYEISVRAGRNLGPYLKILLPCWLIVMFDPFVPCALIAQKSFNEIFLNGKKADVLKFCEKELIQTITNNLLKETSETLSDPKTSPLEEREAKYIRVVSSSMLAFDYIIKNADLKMFEESIKVFAADKTFWKYSKHSSGLIRSSFYTLILTCLLKSTVISEYISMLASTILNSFDEQDSTVVRPLWDLILIFTSKFQECWSHVNVRKAVFPKLWKMLKNCGYGNITIIYPNLVLFLSHLPKEIVGAENFFFNEFLSSLTEGLLTNANVLLPADVKLLINSYKECFQYMLLQNITNEKVKNYLLNDQLHSTLQQFFNLKELASYGSFFFMQLNYLISFIKSKSSYDTNQLLNDVWSVISNVVIPPSKTFLSANNHFYEMLLQFVECMCTDKITKNKSNLEDNQYLTNLLCSIYSCFDSSKEEYKYIIKILCYYHDINVLKFILNTSDLNYEYVNNLDVCCKFHAYVLVPLTKNETNLEDISQLSISLHELLQQSEIVLYLNYIFKEKLSQEYSLSLLNKVLDSSDCSVLSWLKSEAQNIFIDLLNYKNILNNLNTPLKYLMLLEGQELDHYANVFISTLKRYFHETYNTELAASFISICKSTCNVTIEFVDVWFLILEKKRKADSQDALLCGFCKIANSSYRNDFHNVFMKWTIENCFDDIMYHDDVLTILSYPGHEAFDGFCFKLAKDLLSVEYWKLKDSKKINAILFYSKFLERICLKFPLDSELVIDTTIRCMSEDNNVLENFVLNYEEHQIELFQKLIRTRSANELHYFLSIFQKHKRLDKLLNKCFSLIIVENFTDKLCVAIGFLNEVSEIKRLADHYISELLSGVKVEEFKVLLKVIWCILSQWQQVDNNCNEEYKDYATDLLNYIVTWCSDNNHLLLLSTSISNDVSLDKNLMSLLCHLLLTAGVCMRTEHWDFYLCSLVAWLQTCEETFLSSILTDCSIEFMISCYEMFRILAAIFDKYTKCSYPPLIGLSISFDGLVNDTLISEWKEFFLPACHASIHNVAMKALLNEYPSVPEKLCYAISSAMQFVSREYIIENLFKNITSEMQKKKVVGDLFRFLNKIIFNGPVHFKLESYHILSKLSDFIEEFLCKNIEPESSEYEQLRLFPDELLENITKSHDVVLLILSKTEVSITNPLRGITDKDHQSSLLTYLLSWQLVIQVFKMASPSNRSLFANFFHKFGTLNELITFLCCIMKQSYIIEKIEEFKVTTLAFEDLQTVSFHLFDSAMNCMPALIRSWFSKLDRKDAAYVEKFTSSYITPNLLKKEFNKVTNYKQDLSNNMSVKALPVAREIIAKYSIEEMTMELVLTLPTNYPLSPVNVECGKRFGVSTAEWRQWMLQLTTFLSFQNGAVSDGLQMWKNNVNKRFEGVEECMVCFSIIHPSNYSLPTIACKTCKKKFHPVCLYKWFGTSGKSTCPLCRDQF
ncbi:E3 ubiquitin-protein ligase listerin isoform X1 [Hydra vulgaris]|uniref:E3 ubiquitin-protein ligase listerin isoform X1 n=1 Tax=Hydra vulgaris TaxID=6087 RepID=UPI000640BC24|nr:E3 ubiquitin-protein ligase listerin [Hydra vulgaris]XP_047128608.1 E3 ubiquitin-protein ligase listerin [Hydra vulgaris]